MSRGLQVETRQNETNSEIRVKFANLNDDAWSDWVILPTIQGEQGEPGEPGSSGYTPQRGVDYWTDADKAEIKSYVDNAILNGAW